MTPLARDLARALESLRKERGLGCIGREAVFVGTMRGRLTRFGAAHEVHFWSEAVVIHVCGASVAQRQLILISSPRFQVSKGRGEFGLEPSPEKD